NIAESYATEEDGELWLINSYIPEYLEANRFNHNPRRRRKLLLHKKQMAQLASAVNREGMTIVPNRLYFNDRGVAKLQIALAKGRKAHDKREHDKERDWKREQGRLLREKG
ncbi:MAG TPA: SsrA-binding protein SmpB, partial [Rhizobiaceae bacterium]|nr:SsrA-binding protein SmpB [Rhizobiaceae bacterium]